VNSKIATALFFMALALPSTALADFEKGKSAYDHKDYAAALAEWTQGAQAGDAKSQHRLGLMYVQGVGVPQDQAKALSLFQAAAKAGYAKGQAAMGNMYAYGFGVAKDDAQALKWYRKAAEQNDGGAQFNIGLSYAQGHGVKASMAEAVNWYRKAAENGVPEAQNSLGAAYRQGDGVQQDAAESTRWLRKAADQGLAEAQYNLCVDSASGDGVPENDIEAASWCRKAARQGLAQAQQALGIAYHGAFGLYRNDAEAVFWLTLSESKEPAAAKALQEARANLSAPAAADVQARIVLARQMRDPDAPRHVPPKALLGNEVAVTQIGNVAHLVWNQHGEHFTLEIPGKSFRLLSADGRYLLAADSFVVQVGSVAVAEFQQRAGGKSAAQILAAHRDWEAKFLGGGKPQSAEIDLGIAGKGLLWGFDTKAASTANDGRTVDPTTKQLYLTWLNGDRVVVLNGVVNSHTPEAQVRALLEQVAKSFHAGREPIDIETPVASS
jgi:TPR repeat protein